MLELQYLEKFDDFDSCMCATEYTLSLQGLSPVISMLSTYIILGNNTTT